MKSAHQTLPTLHGQAPGVRLGVCEHRWAAPGLSVPMLGSHTALHFQVNTLPLLTASPGTFAIWVSLQTHSRGLSGRCPLAARAGEAKRAALDAPAALAAPFPAVCWGISSPWFEADDFSMMLLPQGCPWHHGTARLVTGFPCPVLTSPPTTAGTNLSRHVVSGRNPFYIPELHYK